MTKAVADDGCLAGRTTKNYFLKVRPERELARNMHKIILHQKIVSIIEIYSTR